ncbi:hypothetical protein [Bosea sp. NBC_00550]|uniref:hypothetical protein n=1 Tax=Bosea sp. NBC_00550 TaxID=2969621 RepID=UPI002230E2C2|nr:hypothetical protein [Bosea sp. NBC_00550]UZF93028.1 hypothetical protein NWE53_02080 [Bosea sp. NBC_00550]
MRRMMLVLAACAVLAGCQTANHDAEYARIEPQIQAIVALMRAGKIKRAEGMRRQYELAKTVGGFDIFDEALWRRGIALAEKHDRGLMTQIEVEALHAQAEAERSQQKTQAYAARVTAAAAWQASRPRTCIRSGDFVNCF